MTMERWRLLESWDASPRFNMGLDEALLEHVGPPTLRFYSWSPDTLSLGYFQRFADVAATSGAGAVVRRITGGGAIHHVNELTFSISVDRGHALYRGPISESYVHVHGAIAHALEEFGVDARMREERELLSEDPDTGMCFHASSPVDLVWGERKGVGSAQRRRAKRILHHGSIKLAASRYETGVATASDGGRDIDCALFAPVLLRAFEAQFGVAFDPAEPTDDELELAEELGGRYESTDFVRRR